MPEIVWCCTQRELRAPGAPHLFRRCRSLDRTNSASRLCQSAPASGGTVPAVANGSTRCHKDTTTVRWRLAWVDTDGMNHRDRIPPNHWARSVEFPEFTGEGRKLRHIRHRTACGGCGFPAWRRRADQPLARNPACRGSRVAHCLALQQFVRWRRG